MPLNIGSSQRVFQNKLTQDFQKAPASWWLLWLKCLLFECLPSKMLFRLPWKEDGQQYFINGILKCHFITTFLICNIYNMRAWVYDVHTKFCKNPNCNLKSNLQRQVTVTVVKINLALRATQQKLWLFIFIRPLPKEPRQIQPLYLLLAFLTMTNCQCGLVLRHTQYIQLVKCSNTDKSSWLERLSIVLSLKNNIIDQRSSISYIFSIYVAAIPFVLRQINLQLFKALVRSVKKLWN